MAHVFISYKSEDHEFAFELNQQLKDAGFDTWIDKEWLRAGEDWREEIDDAITNSFAMVLVLSPQAAKSKYVVYEFAFAWALNVKVVPVMLEFVDLREFHPRLEGRQYEDFQTGRPWGKVFQRIYELQGNSNSGHIHIPRNSPEPIKNAVHGLNSLDSNERRKAIDSLMQIDHPLVIEVFAQAVDHLSKDVRTEAPLKLALLTDYTDHRAVKGLLEIIQYGNRESIKQAAEALGKIGDLRATPPLIEALEANRGGSDGVEAIVRALGRLKAIDAVTLIINVLNIKSWPERKAAADALGEIGEAQARPHLVRALNDWNMRLEVRIAAVRSLGKLQDSSVIVDLLPIFHNRNADYLLRAAVADVLGDLGDAQTATDLKWGLQEQDTNLLRSVIRSLGKLKAERSVDLLIPLLNIRSLTISSVTVEALENIGTPEALYAVEQWKKQAKES